MQHKLDINYYVKIFQFPIWDLRTILSHTQWYTATCIDNALEPKIHLAYYQRGSRLGVTFSDQKIYEDILFVCLLLYILYIFYICIYIYTHILYSINYCVCGTWLSYHELQKHTNSSKHLHLQDSFSSRCPEILMPCLAPYSITSFCPVQSLPKGWI